MSFRCQLAKRDIEKRVSTLCSKKFLFCLYFSRESWPFNTFRYRPERKSETFNLRVWKSNRVRIILASGTFHLHIYISLAEVVVTYTAWCSMSLEIQRQHHSVNFCSTSFFQNKKWAAKVGVVLKDRNILRVRCWFSVKISFTDLLGQTSAVSRCFRNW